jgi:hypothetical protein
MSEIVEDVVTSCLIHQEDDHALAERLVQLIESPATVAKMGQAGRRRVPEGFL